MTEGVFCLTSALVLGLSLSLNTSPTPTPTPRRPPSRVGSAANRGAHLGLDRSAQTPVPRPTPPPKSKSSPSGARKSPTPTPSKAAKSPTPSSTPTPQKEISPAAQSSPTPSVESKSVPPAPTPSPSPSISPVSRPTKIELTFTKFEPQHGSLGDRDYRSARLSYRISVPDRMEFPTINFTVETSSGKLFERVFVLPAGSAFVDPGDNTERTVALDPVQRDDWAEVYAKTGHATFSWSIEGQSGGRTEMPVKKPWP